MPPLNVVALVSGGKDSLFSILHCMANGHHVIALGNLHPEQSSLQDMDSFMYQTVGHNMIDLIAQCLELPLYRQAITGSAVSTSKTYAASNGHQSTDEVENMSALLTRIKSEHPMVNAVSTGAILSDYQRTRVESVAIRLGLTPLSYLWQYPFLPPYDERQLLSDMSVVGQDSRIIKVASGSLDEAFLWTNVADVRAIARLTKAAERFGQLGDGAVVGEGGEYETLTIDGPSPLWKQRIEIPDAARHITNGEGGTAVVHLSQASLVRKSQSGETHLPRIPALWDHTFDAFRDSIHAEMQERLPGQEYVERVGRPLSTIRTFTSSSEAVDITANLVAPGKSAADQTYQIISDLKEIYKIDSTLVSHTTILLRSMDDFPTINKIYGSFFNAPNPPSRVTVACGDALPKDVRVSISLNHNTNQQREGLHVQSQSYWAPANIGPYSQAIAIVKPRLTESSSASSLVHIAGQIPLVPATMEMHAPTPTTPVRLAIEQTLLSAQHLFRIGQIMKVNLFLGALVFIGRDAVSDILPYVHAAARVWTALHQRPTSTFDDDSEGQDEDVDVWDLKHGLGRSGVSMGEPKSTYRDTVQKACVPPFFAAEVQTLPRNAPVEWSSTGWSERGAKFRVERGQKGGHRQLWSSGDQKPLAGWVALRDEEDVEHVERLELPRGIVCTLYVAGAVPDTVVERLRPVLVPCFRLWDGDGNDLLAVLSYVVAR
ncbi:hypothetical protein C1H76_1472 [Elsinoe australis]|uniref:Diphthine--ammonia ligase n=1 Tax=Elsinoe australis TaxID=40998 RepID=A0A4U7B993_9PEZI|nr:hypothetical protein C1H76_1472 [Elsinoe australis]